MTYVTMGLGFEWTCPACGAGNYTRFTRVAPYGYALRVRYRIDCYNCHARFFRSHSWDRGLSEHDHAAWDALCETVKAIEKLLAS